MGSAPCPLHRSAVKAASRVVFLNRRSSRHSASSSSVNHNSVACEIPPSPLHSCCEKLEHTEHVDLSRARAAIERLYKLESYVRSEAAAELARSWRPGCFLVTVEDKPPKSSPKSQEKCSDYYANVGDAIRTLRDEIPLLFEKDLTYDIYREDIVFKDPRNSFQGMKNYKIIFWSLRFHGRIFFRKLQVEVKRLWSPEDGVIKMRWTVRGIPRLPWEAEGTFDGISEYKLDSSGKIYQHTVDNVILRDPPFQRVGPFLAGLNLVPAVQQQPCPGAWCAADNMRNSTSLSGQLHSLTWMRFYSSVLATLQLVEAYEQAVFCRSAPEVMLDF